MMEYTKPPLTIDEQIDLLVERGMEVSERAKAARYLSHINYYRLRAYWLPFEVPSGNDKHSFKSGTRFEEALSLYVFDRKFRLLVLEAIERVEVSFRTRFAYVLANKYGSHAYLKSEYFRKQSKHEELMGNLKDEILRNRETFIKHYQSRYSVPELPPIWAICEIMSFGQLSIWFEQIKNRRDRKAIADIYKFDEKILRSFMHHLSHVRNLVAHHCRLWNRQLTFTMSIPGKPAEIVEYFNKKADRKIYNTLVMLAYILNLTSPGTTWPERLRKLILDEELVDPGAMGFPSNWREIKIWKNEYSK